MKKMLLPALAALFLLTATPCLFAQTYIEILNMSSQEDLYLSDEDLDPDNKNAAVIEFAGEVMSGTEKVVVLYYRNSNELIEEYTLGKFKSGDTTFLYKAGVRLHNLTEGSNYYEFRAYRKDGRCFVTRVSLYVYRQSMAERAKPVIYLYPQTETEVTVSVAPVDGLLETVPEMGEAWVVTARSDGLITAADGSKWPYLFWESKDNAPVTEIPEGFCVKEKDLEKFFREKLRYLGLFDNEINDFLAYWIPEMKGNPWYAIRFVPRAEQDTEAPLTVSPAPDSVIRVYFEYVPLTKKKAVREQVLESATRSGFAVIEWGGRRFKR